MALSIAKTKNLFKKAYFHNWDDGLMVLKKITNDTNCDKATATMIFWHGRPEYFYNHPNKPKMATYEQEMYQFLQQLANHILSDHYPVVISYAMEDDFAPKSLGEIPLSLADPIQGSIDYGEVLYPNNNPFDEQITELCKNCQDVIEMYALEKQGADFSLKIMKGYTYPVQLACNANQTGALQYFIEKKYDFNKKYDKKPLFWEVVLTKQIPLIEQILGYVKNINQKGEFGRTILHYIVSMYSGKWQEHFVSEMGHVFTFLIEKGANLQTLDGSKKTPLDLARMWNSEILIEYLNKIDKRL